MKALVIERTQMTPGIIIDHESGKIQIEGRSVPDNPFDFYQPVFENLDEYKINPKETTEVNINLEYFNTSSLECIYLIFSKLSTVKKTGKKINLNWYYMEGDSKMLEAGEEFQTIIEIPVNLIKFNKADRDSFYHNN